MTSIIRIRNMITAIFCMMLSSACAGENPENDTDLPSMNPYLAQVYNNQGHWNDANTDSTAIEVPRGHYTMTPTGFQIVPNDGLGIPAYTAEVNGKRIHWFFAGASMRKLHWEDGRFVEIDRLNIELPFENYRNVDAEERLAQAKTIEMLLKQQDEKALADYLKATPNRLLSAVEDQVNAGILYSLFSKDHALIGSNARGLIKITNKNPEDPFSKLNPATVVRLPDRIFDDAKVARLTIFPRDVVFGLSMSFNGYLVINTIGGRIVTLDRESLEIIDIYEAEGADELFSNSFATSAELNGGAIYVASNRKMYRFRISETGEISDAKSDGAWSAQYDFGTRLPYGKIADGTGATPTLMGFKKNEDELVVITDGASKMRLVAFWRNEIPSDHKAVEGRHHRIADQITVDMGPNTTWVQSEQSVVAHGNHAFVVNGVPPQKAAPYLTRGSYYRGLLLGTTRVPPYGAAMYKWDEKTNLWSQAWMRNDIAVLATVPFISSPGQMVIVNGYFKDRQLEGFHLGLDLDTGETVMSISTGADPLFNGTFTGVKCDHDGALMYTTMFGLVRFEVDKMRVVQAP